MMYHLLTDFCCLHYTFVAIFRNDSQWSEAIPLLRETITFSNILENVSFWCQLPNSYLIWWFKTDNLCSRSSCPLSRQNTLPTLSLTSRARAFSLRGETKNNSGTFGRTTMKGKGFVLQWQRILFLQITPTAILCGPWARNMSNMVKHVGLWWKWCVVWRIFSSFRMN